MGKKEARAAKLVFPHAPDPEQPRWSRAPTQLYQALREALQRPMSKLRHRGVKELVPNHQYMDQQGQNPGCLVPHRPPPPPPLQEAAW